MGVWLRLRQDFSENLGDPVVSRRAIVSVISITVLKKLRQAATCSVTEEAFLSVEITTDHVRDLHKRALLEDHQVAL